jgi:DNA-binding response OmpR family regulator
MLLRAAGHDVVACSTGAEATLLGAAASPDVLIADLFLHPSCNGIDVALSLRAVLPKLEVIFMTGLPAIASRYVRRLDNALILKKSLSLAVLVEDILGLLAVLGPRGQ